MTKHFVLSIRVMYLESNDKNSTEKPFHIQENYSQADYHVCITRIHGAEVFVIMYRRKRLNNKKDYFNRTPYSNEYKDSKFIYQYLRLII